MEVHIRPFTPDDYPAVLSIANTIYPEYQETVEDWRHYDESLGAEFARARWVAEAGGEIAGFASYFQHPHMYHPTKFEVTVQVMPGRQGQGLGKSLYATVWDDLVARGVTRMLTYVRDDHPHGVGFAERRGFREEQRERESVLDLDTFDPAPFEEDLKAIDQAGLRVASYTELADDPERDRKYAELDDRLVADMPSTEEHTVMSPEQFRKMVLEHHGFLPEATLFALDGDRMVAVSALFGPPRAGAVENGTTGVLREYRKRGIATALKVRNVLWAREQGLKRIRTWNESNNRAMLGINERLGFRASAAWLAMAKDIGTEENK